jgi:hypothetical protein
MTAEKCLHPACGCLVTKGGRFGKFCSEHCKEAATLTELRCHCHHPECSETRPIQDIPPAASPTH